jgi:flagellar biosynthesis/type III secretory pathway protein FliH
MAAGSRIPAGDRHDRIDRFQNGGSNHVRPTGKAQRDYLWAIQGARDEGIKIGIEQGIEQGMERGLEQGVRAGKIQLLQQLLNLVPDSTASLLERSPEELDSMLSDLQQQLRLRG